MTLASQWRKSASICDLVPILCFGSSGTSYMCVGEGYFKNVVLILTRIFVLVRLSLCQVDIFFVFHLMQPHGVQMERILLT